MNREDALKNARSFCYEDRIDDFIDVIYNDFESRTCGNCKHYREESESCWNTRSFVYNVGIAIHKSYVCNKWGAKDD